MKRLSSTHSNLVLIQIYLCGSRWIFIAASCLALERYEPRKLLYQQPRAASDWWTDVIRAAAVGAGAELHGPSLPT